MQQLRWLSCMFMIAGLVACAPRQPTQPDQLPVPHEEALPAPAADRQGGARRGAHVRPPVPADPVVAAGAAAAMAAARASARPNPNLLRLEVSLSARELRVERAGERAARYPIAIGQPSHPTPTGDFAIHQIDWNPDWTPPDSDWAEARDYKAPGEEGNPMGRVRMIYQAPYSIHGTTDLESLGEPESHGSIRMANEDIIELAKLVMAAGGEARSESWFDEVLANPTEMVSIMLPEPVPLVNRE